MEKVLGELSGKLMWNSACGTARKLMFEKVSGELGGKLKLEKVPGDVRGKLMLEKSAW